MTSPIINLKPIAPAQAPAVPRAREKNTEAPNLIRENTTAKGSSGRTAKTEILDNNGNVLDTIEGGETGAHSLAKYSFKIEYSGRNVNYED